MAVCRCRLLVGALAMCSVAEAALRAARETQRHPLAPDDDDWARAVQESLSSFGLLHASGDTDEEDARKSVPPTPIRTQIPEAEVDALIDSLSPECARRVEAMMRGDGPPLHTFGTHEMNGTAPNCHRLHGCLCDNRVYVEKIKTSAEDRAVRETVEITGHSCLPVDCTRTERDLRGIAGFARDQARESLGSTTTHLELHVDCTATAGSQKVSVGVDEPQTHEPPAPPVSPVPADPRSGAPRAAWGVGAVIALATALSS